MDRHHAVDRAAGGIGCRCAAHPRRAGGRRQLSHQGHQDLHHLWRPRHDRQYRAFRAGAIARRAGGHQRHFAVSDSEISRQPRRLAGRAQRHLRQRRRAQARHARFADLHHDHGRSRRCDRLFDRRRKPRHAMHVHDYEQGPARGRARRRRHRRPRLPTGARLCPGAPPAARGALLTPIAKAFSTDIGNEVASLGVQIHGGMGFIEETGAAQHYRDARITPIYEGTNGIQSIDLVTRKLAANGGEQVWALLDELKGTVNQVEASNDPAFGTTGAKLRDALASLERTSRWLLERVTSAPNDALAGATPYLRLFGSTLGGCMLAAEALAARSLGEGDSQRYVTLARFFAENISVQAPSLERTVMDSAEAVNGADVVLLG